MKKTFIEFAESKKEQLFAEQFDNLCCDILNSDMPFEQFWTEHAIPVLLNSQALNESELLNELGWPKWMGGQGVFNKQPHPMAQKMGQAYQDQQAAAMQQKNDARQAKLQKHQGTVNQSIQSVKNQFVQSMRDFINAMSTKAKMDNDYVTYKVAKTFYQKIMGAAQPIIDKFNMTARYGKRDDGDEFNKERETLMNAERSKQAAAQRQDRLRGIQSRNQMGNQTQQDIPTLQMPRNHPLPKPMGF